MGAGFGGVTEAERLPFGFKSAHFRAQLASCGIGLSVATAALLSAVRVVELVIPNWLEGAKSGEIGPLFVAFAFGWVGMATVGSLALAIATFLSWLYRVAQNARSIGRRRPHSTANMAVLCWFIPVVCWFRPYRVVKALYWASETPGAALPRDWLRRLPALFPLWWATWIVSSALYDLAFQFRGTQAEVWLNVVAVPFKCIAGASLAAVIWSIQARQEHLARHGESSAPSSDS